MEIWKDIKGFEGFYQVSNLGNVKALSRIVANSENGTRKVSERVMRSRFNKKTGYNQAVLCVNHRRTYAYVHRLVAEAFIENPNMLKVVNHINGVKDHNHVDNLEWVTHSENNSHSYQKLGRVHNRSQLGKTGKLHHRSKRINQLSLSGELVKVWDSIADIRRDLKLTESRIIGCCKKLKRFKSTGGYMWEYADNYKFGFIDVVPHYG